MAVTDETGVPCVSLNMRVAEAYVAGIREVVEILRKIGWGRPADDVELYLGGVDEEHNSRH